MKMVDNNIVYDYSCPYLSQ